MVLKKHYKVNVKREYRCFIYKQKFIAMCQKHTGDYYKEIAEEGQASIPDIK